MKTTQRTDALKTITAVFEHGRSLDDALDRVRVDHSGDTEPQIAYTRALASGVIRHRTLLETLAGRYLKKPLKARDHRIAHALLIGIYQLGWMRTPAHAAVNESVGLVREKWARGLINAVLRAYQRDGCPTELNDTTDLSQIHSHPGWLVDQLARDWPDDAASILANNNLPAPMTLRVSARQGTREKFLTLLDEHQMKATAGLTPHAVTLDAPTTVSKVPGFDRGLVSVQDQAGQLVAGLVDEGKPVRILDACAAPGSKAMHLAERQADGTVDALDVSPERLERIAENAARLKIANVQLVAGDATRSDWWDGQPYDAILVDAPCSGTGVIRRHPDIKWLRRADDIENLARLQQQILNACWEKLKSGGRLIYTTCSVLKAENSITFQAFLDRHENAETVAIELPEGRREGPGWQILPGESDMDGFFYAVAIKRD